MTPQQFPRLQMTLDDLELTTATQTYTDGQPAQRPHTLRRVSLHVCRFCDDLE